MTTCFIYGKCRTEENPNDFFTGHFKLIKLPHVGSDPEAEEQSTCVLEPVLLTLLDGGWETWETAERGQGLHESLHLQSYQELR